MPRLKTDTMAIWAAVRNSNGEPIVSSVGAYRTKAEKWAFKVGNCRVEKIAEVPKFWIERETDENQPEPKPRVRARKPEPVYHNPEPKPVPVQPKPEPVRYADMVQLRNNQEQPVRRRGRPKGSKNRPKVSVWG